MTDYKFYLDNGIFDIRNGSFQQAVDNINKSLELKDDWEIPHFFLGVANQALENFDEALLDYTKALSFNPKMTDAYYNRAKIMLTRKDIKNPDMSKIVSDLEKSLELDPNFIDALYAMAAAQKKLGNYLQAIEYLGQLLKLEPEAINAKALKKLLEQKYL